MSRADDDQVAARQMLERRRGYIKRLLDGID